MSQVMVRRPQLKGNLTLLKPAEVLSQSGDTMRVRIIGEHSVLEVQASETSPMTAVFGEVRPNFSGPVSLPQKCYSDNQNSLASKLARF
jgi:hypothetical protein